jgi:carbonic anhydrase
MSSSFSRRSFVHTAGLAGGLAALGAPAGAVEALGVPATVAPDVPERRPVDGREALRLLMAGNQRWVRGRVRRPNQTVGRRREVAGGQAPFAVVFSCIDSRVPPELVFDRGLGDLFVVRTGAQTTDDVTLGSVEYGPVAAGTPLVFVLGHERCGAVDAAIEAIAHHGGDAPGHLAAIVRALEPAYHAANGRPGRLEDNMVRAQTQLTVAGLRQGKLLGDALIVGGRYDLDTGRVDLVA